jgi:hypothetical protein
MDLHFSSTAAKRNGQPAATDARIGAFATGAYTFFLEEYNLKPGDFHLLLREGARRSNEVDERHLLHRSEAVRDGVQAVAASRAVAGQGGTRIRTRLSRRQKDLIAATHRLIREGDKYTDQERKDGYEAVAPVRKNSH